MSIRIKLAVTALTLSLASVALAQTPAKPSRIRGEIVSLGGDTLTVHRRSGDTVKIAVKADTPVTALRNIKLQDIKPGSFVGTAAMTGVDGKLTATEVLVFPESARGMGEGHYAWDMGSNSSMTNANVDEVVQSTHGRDLKLSYPPTRSFKLRPFSADSRSAPKIAYVDSLYNKPNTRPTPEISIRH